MKVAPSFLVSMAVCAAISACAVTEPRYPMWGFTYRSDAGNQHVAVRRLTVRSAHYILDDQLQYDKNGRQLEFHGESFSGRQELPESIYVEWRNEEDESIHQQQIDLRGLLPPQLERTDFTLLFQHDKVYLLLFYMEQPAEPGKSLPKWVYGIDRKYIQLFPAANDQFSVEILKK